MKTTLTLVVLLTAAGCALPTIRELSENNGSLHELTFHLPAYATAVGTEARLQVTRGNTGRFECTPNSGFTTSVYMGPAETCRFLGKPATVAQVITARCTSDCDIAIEGAHGLVVTARTGGQKTIEVSARLDDGTVHVDRIDLAFAAPDRIAVDCASTTLCPGRHAVFAGAKFTWVVGLRENDVAVAGDLSTSIVPEGVIAIEGSNVHAIAPGTAQVTYRYGALSRTLTVRVAALDEVVSGDIHGLAETLNPWTTIDADTEVVGPIYGAGWNFGIHLPVWTLRDGTTALGLARLASVKGAGTTILLQRPTSDFEPLFFQVGNPDRCDPGTFTVEVDAGKAKAVRTFDLLCM